MFSLTFRDTLYSRSTVSIAQNHVPLGEIRLRSNSSFAACTDDCRKDFGIHCVSIQLPCSNIWLVHLQIMSVPSLAFISMGLSERAVSVGIFCVGGVVIFGHETAVVGASRSSRNSSTDVLLCLEAADRLQRDIEKPGALSDVSNGPLRILIGLMLHACADCHH